MAKKLIGKISVCRDCGQPDIGKLYHNEERDKCICGGDNWKKVPLLNAMGQILNKYYDTEDFRKIGS